MIQALKRALIGYDCCEDCIGRSPYFLLAITHKDNKVPHTILDFI